MSSLLFKRPKDAVAKRRKRAAVKMEFFRVRGCNFSLGLREIGPSKSFGPRRKAALRGEAYAWTPVLGSFVKLREEEDLSYLGFTLYLSIL